MSRSHPQCCMRCVHGHLCIQDVGTISGYHHNHHLVVACGLGLTSLDAPLDHRSCSTPCHEHDVDTAVSVYNQFCTTANPICNKDCPRFCRPFPLGDDT
jgi:hypothetical protein